MQLYGDEALEYLGRKGRKPKTKFGKALRKMGRAFVSVSAAVSTGGMSLIVQKRQKKLRAMLSKMTPAQRADYKRKHTSKLRKLLGKGALAAVFAPFAIAAGPAGIAVAARIRKRRAARRKSSVVRPPAAAVAAMVPTANALTPIHSEQYEPAGELAPAALPTGEGPVGEMQEAMPEVQPEDTDMEAPESGEDTGEGAEGDEGGEGDF